MAKLLPILLAIIGLAGGGAAGFFLRPDPAEKSQKAEQYADCPPSTQDADGHGKGDHGADKTAGGDYGATEYVKFENQFVVPVTSADAITSLVVLSLELEVSEGSREVIFARLPKLRDAFLSVLFDHSSAGGFSIDFVNGHGLDTLSGLLKEAAVGTAGTEIVDVLIVDLVKQDV